MKGDGRNLREELGVGGLKGVELQAGTSGRNFRQELQAGTWSWRVEKGWNLGQGLHGNAKEEGWEKRASRGGKRAAGGLKD